MFRVQAYPFKNIRGVPVSMSILEHGSAGEPHGALDRPVSELACGEKQRLQIGLALTTIGWPAPTRRAACRHEPATHYDHH
ncbi:hypothetical protein NKH70_24840 [Mesorhizobium sp. M0991]|uniref:hypothetical protein n=1 Tax=unclassified Mesorhizobium TaxID=325217 RepID=UPI0033361C0C